MLGARYQNAARPLGGPDRWLEQRYPTQARTVNAFRVFRSETLFRQPRPTNSSLQSGSMLSARRSLASISAALVSALSILRMMMVKLHVPALFILRKIVKLNDKVAFFI